METEKELTKNICEYIKLQYKDVIFTVDTSGLKLTIGQATQLKSLRSSRGLPDLMIFIPKGVYKGLFIELKRGSEKLIKKNGDYKTEHLEEQAGMLYRLRELGYCAIWGVGFESTKSVIDEYMALNGEQRLNIFVSPRLIYSDRI